MSAGTAVLVAAGDRISHGRTRTATVVNLRVRLLAFAALALYGTLRWGVLLNPAPVGRLLGMVAVAVALATAGMALPGRLRPLIAVLAGIAAIGTCALAGVPLSWVRHVRISDTAAGISHGLAALPRALVPYSGVNFWLREVITLGAGVLLLSGALTLALAPREPANSRRAAAAVPLIALAVVPSTLVRPSLAYVHGLLLFILLGAFVWGERLGRDEAVAGVTVAAVAAAGAMVAAPRLDTHKPWIDYQSIAAHLVRTHPEAFNWVQSYGPLRWPRKGREVLEVTAPRADYWKAENLDAFNGAGWVQASVGAADPQPTVTAANVRRWTQTLHVTLTAITTRDVIAAGVAGAPQQLSGVIGGWSPGTWSDPAGLGPGDSYTVSVYDPAPSTAQLASAGTSYPAALIPAFLQIAVPVIANPSGAPGSVPGQPAGMFTFNQVAFPPFGSTLAQAYGPAASDPTLTVQNTPYEAVYALAQRLSAGTATPYAFVENVLRYLRGGRFRYDENIPSSAYPISTFLLNAHRGYCQQFAGAMALLLRMGGVPARVATGFTTGVPSGGRGDWTVSDIDAHAWVEAWFPSIGWVRFDPTPAAAPARSGRVSLAPVTRGSGKAGLTNRSSGHGFGQRATAKTAGIHRARAAGGSSVVPLAAGVGAAAAILLLALVSLRLADPVPEQRLAELERALARCGRPLTAGTTLLSLERRFDPASAAGTYVRGIRLGRYAGVEVPFAPAGRRALRAELRRGLGLHGRWRALWALPPRLTVGVRRGGRALARPRAAMPTGTDEPV